MNSTFLSNFIMITNFKTIAFIIILVAILFGVNIMAKKKIKFSTRMIVSTISGLVLGLIIQLVAGFPNNPGEVQWISEVNKWYGLIGYGFMDLLKMLVVPLIFVSIIRVIINLCSKFLFYFFTCFIFNFFWNNFIGWNKIIKCKT